MFQMTADADTQRQDNAVLLSGSHKCEHQCMSEETAEMDSE